MLSLGRKKAKEGEGFHIEGAERKGCHQGGSTRDRHDFYAHFSHELQELLSGVRENWRPAVRNQRHVLAVHQIDQDLLDHVGFVVFV